MSVGVGGGVMHLGGRWSVSCAPLGALSVGFVSRTLLHLLSAGENVEHPT